MGKLTTQRSTGWKHEPVKVLHVIDSLGVGGGAEHSLAKMLPLLRSRGVNSSLAVFIPREGGLQQQLREMGFPLHRQQPSGLSSRNPVLLKPGFAACDRVYQRAVDQQQGQHVLRSGSNNAQRNQQLEAPPGA